jgi:hypothetical protein
MYEEPVAPVFQPEDQLLNVVPVELVPTLEPLLVALTTAVEETL